MGPVNEAAFALGLYAAGWCAARASLGARGGLFVWVSAYAWGTALWIALGVVMLISGLPYVPGVVWSLGALALLVLAIAAHRRAPFSGHDAWILAAAAVACLGTGWLFTRFNLTVVTPDSITFLAEARAFVADHGLPEYRTSILRELLPGWPPLQEDVVASFGPYMALVHSAANLFGREYLPAARPLLFLSAVASVAAVVIRGAHQWGRRLAPVVAVLGLTAAVLLTSNAGLRQPFYIQSNFATATYLLLFTAAAWQGLREEAGGWHMLAGLALVGLTYTRVEGSLLGLIALTPAAADARMRYRGRVGCAAALAVPALVWAARLYATGTFGPNMSAGRLLAVCGALLAFLALMVASRWRPIERCLPALPWLMILALAAGFAVLTFLRPAHMAQSWWALTRTASDVRVWDATIVVAALAFVLARAVRPMPHEQIFTFLVPAYALLMFVLVGLRPKPFGPYWGDSGARMLVHILPIVFLYVALKYVWGLGNPAAGPAEEPEAGEAPSSA